MKHKTIFVATCFICLIGLQGCAGTAAGLAAGTAIEVVKVPLKVAGALAGAVAHTAGALVAETSDGDDE